MSERDETREAVARASREHTRDTLTWDEHLDLIDAALSALRPGSRFTVEGVECVVAPVEPTPEMVKAGAEIDRLEALDLNLVEEIWSDMLRACEEGESR